MKQAGTINGQEFRQMFATATDWLEKSVAEINDLNVFPVPDGDTGTNMLLTMRSCMEDAFKCTDGSVSSIVGAMARGSLLGARGNSGVILSQIWHGIEQSLDGKPDIDGDSLATALCLAAETAREGISDPVEGTILTVIKEASVACQNQSAEERDSVVSVLQAAVDAAREAVANTPNLLPVLMEAGVVDAGGQGLYTILEGALLYLKGEARELKSGKSKMIDSRIHAYASMPVRSEEEEVVFGYCTEFLLKGKALDPDGIKEALKSKGESLIAVGDKSAVRVHIHALDPSEVIHYAVSLGTIHSVSIRNMDEQIADMASARKGKPAQPLGVAVISVVAGEGLTKLFKEFGTVAIVPGGQTMNPSIQDILMAIDSVPSDDIIILPNNKNIVLTAQLAKSISDKNVNVVPTVNIPQGVAALTAYEPEADLPTNIKNMIEAKVAVKTIEITRATRSTGLNGFKIRKNQAIGFLDDELLAVGDETGSVLADILAKTDLSEAEMITMYYGADTEETEAEQIGADICRKYPELEVEVVEGSQPHYNYIVSVE
ncbi:DAK2 domain-containing protein [Chloroflexota bacterium]